MSRLFDGGIAAIGERTGLPCFGVVPWFAQAHLLPAEDSWRWPPSPSQPAMGPPLPQRARVDGDPLSRMRERVRAQRDG